jgi:hypothetical protein
VTDVAMVGGIILEELSTLTHGGKGVNNDTKENV